MKILYIGGGFVGACSAAVSADSGHETLVYDIDEQKVAKLNSADPHLITSCLHEEGLADLIIRGKKRLTFTTNLELVKEFALEVDAVFMCVPTPEKMGSLGETDLTYYEKAAALIAPILAEGQAKREVAKRILIVNKSTVPVKMIDYTKELFAKHGLNNFGIVSNPEFLIEGKAVEGSIRPDRVVVGAECEEDFKVMRQVYQRFYDSINVKYIEVNPYEASAAKLLANFLLFSRIVMAYDIVGRAAEIFPGLNYEKIRHILVTEPRIGSWGFYNSLYSGGSCFTKDAASLAHQMEEMGANASIVRDIIDANLLQLNRFFSRAAEAGFDWKGKTVAVLGLAFKQNTNDIRNSGAIMMVEKLLDAGVKQIQVYDPVAIPEAKKYFSIEKNPLNEKIVYAAAEAEALKGTEALIICTDWQQFKSLSTLIHNSLKVPYLIMDGRRMLVTGFEDLKNAGFTVISVGSPTLN